MRLLDPTLAFFTAIILSPPLLGIIPVDFPNVPLDPWTKDDRMWSYFLDPTLLTGLALTVVVLVYTHFLSGPCQRLSTGEDWGATWFLLNGTIIHFVMDGMTGGFHFFRGMEIQYFVVDKRFTYPFGDERGSCVLLVSYLEIFVMFPLCLFCYYGYHKDLPWRRPLEIVTATFQLLGTIFFAGTEIIQGFPSVPVDRSLSFTPHALFYFWFAFVFCELFWVVVPLCIIRKSCAEVTGMIRMIPKIHQMKAR